MSFTRQTSKSFVRALINSSVSSSSIRSSLLIFRRTFARAKDGPPVRELSEPQGHKGGLFIGGPKVVNTADEAVVCIKSDSTVFIHTAAASPTGLTEAMVRRPELTNMKVVHIHTEGTAPHMSPAAAGRFRTTNFFTGGNAREAINDGRADFVPVFLSEIPLLIRRGIQPVDVALISVSPPDKHGFVSLGPSVDIARAAVQVAKTIIAMVNPQMPRTFGDASIHTSHIDYMWHNDAPLYNLRDRTIGPVEDAIGKLIATELVRDGATLQMGIGGIPDAVLRYLTNHKDLGIHSEMFSDGIIDLVYKGVITGSKKTIHPGRITGGFAVGTKNLYAFMNDNPGIVMRDIAFVNSIANIVREPSMTAINSAIEVDITGQVCADSIGTRIFSGVGGQVDFIRGAGLCPDGVPIIALPSTTNKGESRIVDFLKPGAGVVSTRAHVHYIVTEFGIADLWGKSLRERARQLISIAHPSHRDRLTAAAKSRHLL